MPAKRAPPPGTLAYLAESGRAVFIVCRRCGRCTKADFYKLAQAVGWSAKVDDIAKRLVCACKHRGAKFSFKKPSICPRCLRPFGLDRD